MFDAAFKALQQMFSPPFRSVLIKSMLLALVTIHVLAALHHHFILRDDVLRRMLPWPIRSRIQGLNTERVRQ